MSGLDLKFNEVLYFPGNTLPSSPSVIVPTGFRVSCCWVLFFFLPFWVWHLLSCSFSKSLVGLTEDFNTVVLPVQKGTQLVRLQVSASSMGSTSAWFSPYSTWRFTPPNRLHKGCYSHQFKSSFLPLPTASKDGYKNGKVFCLCFAKFTAPFLGTEIPYGSRNTFLAQTGFSWNLYRYVYVCVRVCVQNNIENNTEIKSAIFLHHVPQVSLLHCQVNSYHLANDSIYSKLPNTTLLAEKTRPQRSIIWPKASTPFPSFWHSSFGSWLLLPFFPKDPSNIGQHHNEYCLLSLPIW